MVLLDKNSRGQRNPIPQSENHSENPIKSRDK